MIRLSKSSTSDKIVVTLEEARTIVNPYYLFVFTNESTREKFKVILNSLDDESPYKERYNKWTINTSTLLGGLPKGKYIYNIYEQVSSTNLDTTGLNLLENGKMLLIGEAIQFIENNVETEYKEYGG